MNQMSPYSCAHRTRVRLDSLAQQFTQGFADAGFDRIPAEPAVPRTDSTVLFTNSAVVPFKPYLRGETTLPAAGVTVRQPCIRAQNLKQVFSQEFSSEHVLQFEMLGTLASPATGPDLARATAAFFHGSLGLGRNEVALKVAADDTDLITLWQRHWSGPILTDTEPQGYYRWGFGDEDLTGRGATFAIQQRNGSYRDIGNLIAFENQGKVAGYGVGLGLETLAACLWHSPRVLDCTPAGALIHPVSFQDAKLADLTGLLARAACLGLRPSSRGRGHVLRRALTATSDLADTLGVPRARLAGWLRDLTRLEGSSPQTIHWMLQHLEPDSSGIARRRTYDLSFWWGIPGTPESLANHAATWSPPAGVHLDVGVKDVYHDETRQSVTLSITVDGDASADKSVLRSLARHLGDCGGELRGHII